MKALTVRQPWAWAIAAGVKPIDNRMQMYHYRGPLAIHAGRELDLRGCALVPELLDATRPDLLPVYADQELVYGAVIAVVDLVDVHYITGGCCDSPWAERWHTDPRTGLQLQWSTHLVFTNPKPIEPIPARGRLSLWEWDPWA